MVHLYSNTSEIPLLIILKKFSLLWEVRGRQNWGIANLKILLITHNVHFSLAFANFNNFSQFKCCLQKGWSYCPNCSTMRAHCARLLRGSRWGKPIHQPLVLFPWMLPSPLPIAQGGRSCAKAWGLPLTSCSWCKGYTRKTMRCALNLPLCF